jgi:hypothetical protein
MEKEMYSTYLIQRLMKPYPKAKGEKETMIQALGNAFAFGGGLKNGGIPTEGMKILREVFRFDYMGSAEFEFGAVPKALAKIVDERKKYVFGILDIIVFPERAVPNIRKVSYLCHKDHEAEVITRIKQLATDEYKHFRLKERCNLKPSLEGREYDKEICGWLELDNAFMFFTDRVMFEKTAKMFGIE